ncbi:UDP-N-acetylmuramoyl-L-alanine--D-glutamate ligase [Actinokineospora globicatena]|uniref:UDP-N-acetylmuramoylalanine--D-glutamate ligase n=1 Tax=Actinokineospora globicatena TaxID=103729 RepID=A0A9W6QM98_9PSEU|nr:UDP-N-acetylmuramoyl-L-alanine--D-glutamate ligase [Actinokineospora globicatena]GLW90913.1 UDP-N-acetylmuramoylalanine--D-glutamate ligase [Actinokineospora globicatena]
MTGPFAGLVTGNVLVAGAGVTGRSVAAALVEMGAEVTVTDGNAERLAELADTGATLVPGLTEPPAGTSLVVTSPGWRPSSPLLASAVAAGIDVIGEVELAWLMSQRLPQPPTWLVVTGTNGKTTTVGMLAEILRADGRNAIACGNVGLTVIDAIRAGHDVLAVELSSFQLHWQRSLRAHAAVVLNLAEDHLDWHGSMEEYAKAKGRAYAGAGVVIRNVADEWSGRLAAEHDGVQVGFGLGVPRPGEVGLVEDLLVDRAFVDDPSEHAEELAELADLTALGSHNVANALAAAALARSFGVSPEAVRAGLRAFRPGAHRAVPLGEVNGVSYVNDSKATNPHAAAGSLLSFESVVWIAGGLLKGAAVDPLVEAVTGRLRGVVLIGADAEVFAASLARHAPDVPVRRLTPGDHEPMIAAVSAAGAMARPGDVVLLAPAAASMDMFRDYAHRGDAFAGAVAQARDGVTPEGSAAGSDGATGGR